MRKKRAITLLEIMIVILLIGLIGGVVSYNLKGTLDKGKAFRSEQGAKKLQDILNLEIQMGHAQAEDLTGKGDEKHKNVVDCVQRSGLITAKQAPSFIRDGWGEFFTIRKVRGHNEVVVTSCRLEDYTQKHGSISGEAITSDVEVEEG